MCVLQIYTENCAIVPSWPAVSCWCCDCILIGWKDDRAESVGAQFGHCGRYFSLPRDVCKPGEAKKKREPMVRQQAVTGAFVSAPCYHVKVFFSFHTKWWIINLWGVYSLVCVLLCANSQNYFCPLGHMQPCLSGIFWRQQASNTLKFSRRCYKNDSSSRNTSGFPLCSVSLFHCCIFFQPNLQWNFISKCFSVYQGHRYSILFRHRLFWRSWWKGCKHN